MIGITICNRAALAAMNCGLVWDLQWEQVQKDDKRHTCSSQGAKADADQISKTFQELSSLLTHRLLTAAKTRKPCGGSS